MQRTDVFIIGGGQAGLAMSRCLVDLGVDHVVVERGRVAQSWRSQRWDSLRLLTPNWQSRLPGWSYRGADPHGFMSMPEIIGHLHGFARSFAAPVLEYTSVLSVERRDVGYRIQTTRGTWHAACVVIATGACGTPHVPAFARDLPPEIVQITPTRYRNPERLPPGGVLVVGASASGVQLADELHRSGRGVTLAVGRHTRLPRSYRGHDIMWWLDRVGMLDQTVADVADIGRARRSPSLQLVGRPDHADLDLDVLARRGVELVGRAVGSWEHRVYFDDDLPRSIESAHDKLQRLLDRVDGYAARRGLEHQLPAPRRPAPIVVPSSASHIDLADRGIQTIVWATGFRPNYPWLKVPVLGARGELVHQGGVTASPGLYALGLRFMRRRNSSFIDGVRHDALEIADEIARHLHTRHLAA